MTAHPPIEGLTVTWIGHSTVLVQMDNINVLTDPVFSSCCSPVRLPGVGVRYRRAACTVDQLPHINAVIISHNHFDHLDYQSVLQLNQRFGADLCWFVPSGLKTWMQSSGCQHVIELNWWQEHEFIKVGFSGSFKFVCVPAQHWSKRGVWDDNKVCVSSFSYSVLAASLVVHSAIPRHQPPQRMVLSQVNCFIQCDVVSSQISLDSVQPHDAREPWCTPVLKWGSC